MSDTDRAPAAEPVPPSVVALRTFADIKHVLALLEAKRAVLLVLHASEPDRQRCLDVLTGWAFGSGGDLDAISRNAVVARPPDAPAVRLARTEIVSAVDEILSTGDRPIPSRDEEAQLRARSAAGDLEAQRVLREHYTEIANLLALVLRPAYMSQPIALRAAHDELDRLVSWSPQSTPLLVTLVNAIYERLSSST